MSASPPGFLRRILERSLPPDDREGIVGDLDEVFRARRSREGAVRSHLWYVGQLMAIGGCFAGERIRDGLSSVGTPVGLDLKLGLRMLVKYPMLTLVATIAITVAAAIGVGATEFVRDLIAPRLPLEGGERIVRPYQIDSEAGGSKPAPLWDLEAWRESLSLVQDLGAFTTMEQGLLSDRGEAGTVSLARTSASAFRVTRVPPLMGRFLLDSDEDPDAPAVVVLGYEAWQRILGADADPIGRTVQLGATPTTVVGIMPESFGFPQVQNAWVALRDGMADRRPESAPRAALFGRLVPGATLESAQAELDHVGRRQAADLPEIYGHLTPRVESFAHRASGGQATLILSGSGSSSSSFWSLSASPPSRAETRPGSCGPRKSEGRSSRNHGVFSTRYGTASPLIPPWRALPLPAGSRP